MIVWLALTHFCTTLCLLQLRPRTAYHAMAEFLQTEAFKFAGEQGEQRVFEAVKAAFQDREALGWWRYPLVSETTVREPDILVIDPELGVIVIEVKSLPLSDLAGVSGYRWQLNRPYFGKTEINPYEQAKAQLQVIMRTLRGRPGLDRVPGRVIVATPLITAHFWIATIGIVFYISAMWVAGIMQGLMWREYDDQGFLVYSFAETTAAMHPYYVLRVLGGLLYLLGLLVMTFNVWKTIRGDVRAEIPLGAEAPALKPAEQGAA